MTAEGGPVGRDSAPSARRGGPLAALVAVWTVAALASLPSGAAAQAGEDPASGFLGAYAILAHDPATGQTGVALASSSFSAGSGLPWLERGAGAAVVLGGGSGAVGLGILETLRQGRSAQAALASAGSTGESAVAVLDEGCGRAVYRGPSSLRWSGEEQGTAGGICYVALGSLLPGPRLLSRAAGAFADSSGDMLDRMHAFLQAADRAAGELALSRSAAVWIDAPDSGDGALGRARLRLQVEDVQRPADALREIIRVGRADALAGEANREVDAGRYDRAVQRADRALELDPANAEAWLARGRALLFLDREAEAETAFQRMLEVNPFLLHVLGDPAADDEGGAPSVRAGMIPYRPRLLLRLDVYRRAFHGGDVDLSGQGGG